MGVKLGSEEQEIVQKEEKLIEFLANKAWDKMDEAQRTEFLEKINLIERFKDASGLSPVRLALATGGAAAMLLYEYVAGAMLLRWAQAWPHALRGPWLRNSLAHVWVQLLLPGLLPWCWAWR